MFSPVHLTTATQCKLQHWCLSKCRRQSRQMPSARMFLLRRWLLPCQSRRWTQRYRLWRWCRHQLRLPWWQQEQRPAEQLSRIACTSTDVGGHLLNSARIDVKASQKPKRLGFRKSVHGRLHARCFCLRWLTAAGELPSADEPFEATEDAAEAPAAAALAADWPLAAAAAAAPAALNREGSRLSQGCACGGAWLCPARCRHWVH